VPTDIRPALPADIGPIAAFDQTRSDPRRAEEISRAVFAGGSHVAVVDGSIAGCVVFRADFFDQGFVRLLLVADNRRRKGIGDALIAAIERTCPTAKLFT
jgi:N-acetylglutamate synthase-like GNAT family acetyltransferase